MNISLLLVYLELQQCRLMLILNAEGLPEVYEY